MKVKDYLVISLLIGTGIVAFVSLFYRPISFAVVPLVGLCIIVYGISDVKKKGNHDK